MVDAGTICSVVCLLSMITLFGGLVGYGQDIFPTCSRRIDLQIEIQILMAGVLLISAVAATVQYSSQMVKVSMQLETVIMICIALSVFCVSVETLMEFIMLIGFNNHCETQMTTLGMVLLWLYVVLGMVFSVPVLVYSIIMIFAIGPLVYFEYKRNNYYRYHNNRAKRMLGKEEGWESFQVVTTPEFMYRSYTVMIQYCIYYCSWEITFDEAVRCVSLGMRCPACDGLYSTGEFVFLDPTSFQHVHTECIEANVEVLKTPQNPHVVVLWNNLKSKLNQIYPREYKPASVERFFEPDGLFRSVLLAGVPEPDGEQVVPAHHDDDLDSSD